MLILFLFLDLIKLMKYYIFYDYKCYGNWYVVCVFFLVYILVGCMEDFGKDSIKLYLTNCIVIYRRYFFVLLNGKIFCYIIFFFLSGDIKILLEKVIF